MSHLLPCGSCHRHIRVSDERCPFCGVALSLEQRASAPPVMPGRRLGRAALFAFGATMMGVAACSDDSGAGKDAGNPPAADGSADKGGGSGGSGTGGKGGSGGAGTGGQSGSGGASNDGGSGGMDGAVDRGGTGGLAAAYGIPAMDAAPVPLYGCAPPEEN